MAFPYPYPDRIAEKAATNFFTEIGLRATALSSLLLPSSALLIATAEANPVFLNPGLNAQLWTDTPIIHNVVSNDLSSPSGDPAIPLPVDFASIVTVGDGTVGRNEFGTFSVANSTTGTNSSQAYWRGVHYFVDVGERFDLLVIEFCNSNYKTTTLTLNTVDDTGVLFDPNGLWEQDAAVLGGSIGTKQYFYSFESSSVPVIIPTPGTAPGIIAVGSVNTEFDTDGQNSKTTGFRWEADVLTHVNLWDHQDPEVFSSSVVQAIPSPNGAEYSSALFTVQFLVETPSIEGAVEQAAEPFNLALFRPNVAFVETLPNQFDAQPADSELFTGRLRDPNNPAAFWTPTIQEIRAVDQEYVIVLAGGQTIVIVDRLWTEYRIIHAIAHDATICQAFTEYAANDRIYLSVFKVDGEFMWLFPEVLGLGPTVILPAVQGKQGELAEGFAGCGATPPFPDPPIGGAQVRSFFTSTQMLLEGDAALDAVLYNP